MSGEARLQGDRGQVGGIEVLPFGFLLFVGVTLLFANVWGVVDAKLAVTSAAREAVRAYAEAPDAAAANAAARTRATDTLSAFGRDGARATIGPPVLARDYGRCVRVSVTVTYEVPAIAIPFLGGLGEGQSVSSTFTEIIDPFRDELAGPATC